VHHEKVGNNIRLLETGYNSAVFNMALDEVLMNELELSYRKDQVTEKIIQNNNVATPNDRRISGGVILDRGTMAEEEPFDCKALAVLRIYGWRPAAVSIGYFQSMELEVQVDECRRRGIDVVRRLTGGGAVYHEAEVTYSFITNIFPRDILQSYKLICNPVVRALGKLGFDAQFAPLNDIVIGNGVKVSGNAQTRRKNVILQHGTILLEVDAEKMFTILKVPSEKMKDKVIDDIKKRVVGIQRPFDEVAKALESSFSETFDCGLVPDNLRPEEYPKVDSLIKEKYSLNSWNWMR
jgi:lipoate---protein ligase